MGTRSTVKFYDESDEPILCVYQQYDGYISGVGHDLAKFLKGKKIVNGIGSGQTMEKGFANGIECLAAQYVAERKRRIGGFYLTNRDDKEEFNYEVRFIDSKFIINVDGFEGSPDGFKGSPEELLEITE